MDSRDRPTRGVRVLQGILENLAARLPAERTDAPELPSITGRPAGVLLRNAERSELADLMVIAAAAADAPTAMILLNENDTLSCQATFGAAELKLPQQSRLYSCAIETDECLGVPDTLTDSRFCEDPLVAAGPRVRFYAGVPLRGSHGQTLGLLCLFDSRPRGLKASQRGALRLIGRRLNVSPLQLAQADFVRQFEKSLGRPRNAAVPDRYRDNRGRSTREDRRHH